MGMEMNLGARLEQNMSMQLNFAQKMALEILQLNVQSLEQRIAEELESNPLLEIKETSIDLEAPSSPETPAGDLSAPDQVKDVESPQEEPSVPEVDHIDAMQDAFEPAIGEGNYLRPSGDDDEFDPLNLLEDRPANFEHFMEEQLNYLNPEPELREPLEVLISLLDERGYLCDDLEDIASERKEDLGIWTKALRFLQEDMEPSGLGARDLQECLLIQTYRMGKGFEREINILSDHFENLSQNKLKQIVQESNYPMKEVLESLEFFKTLAFRPAASFFEEKATALTPDATVKYDPPDMLHEKGRFRIQLAQRGQPELEVIPGTTYRYEGMSKDERKYLNFHNNNAKALVEAVRRRGETLFLVIQAICQRQLSFFEEGKAGLVPLQMQEIAQELEMSAATITRTVKDKAIVTDYGTFELKYFFSMKKVKMGSGQVMERDGVLKDIQDIIDAENKSKPLSDASISKALEEKGHKVAIRTVAKYRGVLSIPSSSKRKHFDE